MKYRRDNGNLSVRGCVEMTRKANRGMYVFAFPKIIVYLPLHAIKRFQFLLQCRCKMNKEGVTPVHYYYNHENVKQRLQHRSYYSLIAVSIFSTFPRRADIAVSSSPCRRFTGDFRTINE